MKKVIILLLGFIVWVSQTSAFAEEPRAINLNQAVAAALTGNLDLQQSQNQMSLKNINLRQKKAGFLPEVSYQSGDEKTMISLIKM